MKYIDIYIIVSKMLRKIEKKHAKIGAPNVALLALGAWFSIFLNILLLGIF